MPVFKLIRLLCLWGSRRARASLNISCQPKGETLTKTNRERRWVTDGA
nr:MAG TPA_asm: hypothetical protein [Caudoviricetes sp.]